MKLSIVIPAHNEEKIISEVILRLEKSLNLDYELVVVNDHSSDGTTKIAGELANNYPNIRLIDNEKEQGFANTLRSGFEAAKGDLILPVMADLCDDPNTILAMHEKIQEGYDIVCGSRYIRGGQKLGGPFLKTFLSSLAGKFIYFIGIPTHDITNSFKMYRKKVIDDIDLKARSFDISMEIPLKAYLKGFRISEVPTTWRSRTVGASNFRVMKLIPDYLKLYTWAIGKKFLKIFSK